MFGPNNVLIGHQKIPQTACVEVVCECTEWKAARERIKRSGIEEQLRKITFENYKTEGKHPKFTTAKQIAKEYVSVAAQDYFARLRKQEPPTRQNGVGLCGEPGAGKTTLLLALGNALLARKVPVLYFQHREEFDKLKATGFRDSEELYERLKNFRGILMWDDLFKTSKRDKDGNRLASDWEVDASWTVINYRIFKDYPIAFSTEWTPFELSCLDRSMAGRLIERCKHPQDPSKDRLITFKLTKEEIAEGLNPITTFDHRFMREDGG